MLSGAICMLLCGLPPRAVVVVPVGPMWVMSPGGTGRRGLAQEPSGATCVSAVGVPGSVVVAVPAWATVVMRYVPAARGAVVGCDVERRTGGVIPSTGTVKVSLTVPPLAVVGVTVIVRRCPRWWR